MTMSGHESLNAAIQQLIGEAESGRYVCPNCQGGSSGERSLKVWREGALVRYICYRSSCGVVPGSFNYATGERVIITTQRDLPKSRAYQGQYLPLTDQDRKYLAEVFNIYQPDGLIFATENDEYVFPVWSVEGEDVGAVVRQPQWSGTLPCHRKGQPDYPKSLTYVDGPELSVYGDRKSDVVVLVEDQMSAIRLSEELTGVLAVALLGTHVNSSKIREIRRLRPYTVVVALDQDATAKTYEILEDWYFMFPDFRAAELERDLKNEKPGRLRTVLDLEDRYDG